MPYIYLVSGRKMKQALAEVTHVIVQRCYDFSKLLRQLRPSLTNNPSNSRQRVVVKSKPHLHLKVLATSLYQGKCVGKDVAPIANASMQEKRPLFATFNTCQ